MGGTPTKPEDAARLLKEAELLYERHQAGRRAPFNVFTALRKSSDEVNLHSRFLHALLDHRKPGDEQRRANLADFVTKFRPGFVSDGAKVERERHNIDILITNGSGQALAIENKIYAEDQDRQIERYYKELKGKGYKDVHILYLTIDDHDPSERSTGDLDKEKYTPIAYGEVIFLEWLGRCQKRAYDEPELRESVAQYLRLIRKMTGNDRGREYMDELKKLLLQGNNLIIARDLGDAVVGARVGAMHHVWQKIESELKNDPTSFGERVNPLDGDPSDLSEGRIRGAIEQRRGRSWWLGWFGLYYSSGIENLPNVSLGVEAHADYGFIVGVGCRKQEYGSQYEKIQEKFADMDGESNEYWPWFRVVRSKGTGLRLDPDDLPAFLKLSSTDDPSDRKNLAVDVCQELKKVRKKLGPTS